MLSHFVRKVRSLGSPADPHAVRVGSLVWHLTPEARGLFADAPPDPHAWAADGRAVVVKRNLQRTVSRVTLPGGVVYLKRCRANTPRAWVREVLRPPKARLEFENTVAVRAKGLPCVEPLGWAETDSVWPGDSYYLSRECPDAVAFDTFLNTPPPPALRRQLAHELGALFARMHQAGVSHPDPHAGNFLVTFRPDGSPAFVLLDVHAVRFGEPLKWVQALDNLVLLNRWFQIHGSRTDRARFWRAYQHGHPDSSATPHQVEAATEASNLRFWAARTGRYLGNNSGFKRVKAGNVRGHVVRDLPEAVWGEWLADPDAVFARPGVKLLKDSRSSTVAVLGDDVIFKRFRLKSPLAAAKNLFRRSSALRSWVFGHNLIERGLPTARPLFVAHRRRFGVPTEGYIAFEKIPDAVELPDAVAASDRQQVRELAGTLGRLIRRMHERQVSHRDLKAPNILISGPTREPVLIDLVGLTVGKRVPQADRVRDLARLNASFLHTPQVSRTDRLRFLVAYLGRTERRNALKSWWKLVAVATDTKVRKNLQSGRPLS